MMVTLVGPVRQVTLILLVIAGLVIFTGCATMQIPGRWVGPGQSAAPETAWTYINDHRAIFAASNDTGSVQIAVRFRITDTMWARSCDMTGLTVWLAGPGMKRNDFGILIASGPFSSRTGNRVDIKPGEPDIPQQGVRARHHLGGGLAVMRKGETIPARPDGSLGPSATFTSRNGMCTYALSVPIRNISDTHLGLSLNPGEVMTVGFTAGYDPGSRAAREAYWHDANGGGPPEPGPRSGAGPRGLGGSGRPGANGGPRVPEHLNVWINVKLAKP